MKTQEQNEVILAHPTASISELCTLTGLGEKTVRNRRKKLGLAPLRITSQNKPAQSVQEEIINDVKRAEEKQEKITDKKKYEAVMAELKDERRKNEILLGLNPKARKIKEGTPTHTGEAIAFAILSDLHAAEHVDPEVISDMNEFSPDIARVRTEAFFRNTLRLIKKEQHGVQINTLVLGLLGDLINNTIHPDAMASNNMEPMEEAEFVEGLLMSGIDFLLENSDLNLIIQCHSGNHARTTQERRTSTEAGNSLEWLMYQHLSKYYRTNKRVTINVSKGYHSYFNAFDKWLIRMHHGHAIRYAGGVGGIYISVNKAINQWNKMRHAYLDIFGHFHQFRDGGNFISNGSVVGYNAFALEIKADYEEPRQAFFLIDRKRGKTITAPILLNE